MTTDSPSVFSQVISLGTHCYSASLLKRAGLRRHSGPFDWIFANPGVIRHCIESDFDVFLDRSQHISIPIEERPDPNFFKCRHKYYHEKFGVPYMFNHHDLTNDEEYQYIERCVNRFRSALADGKVLGVQAFLEGHYDAQKEFAKTIDCLSRYAPDVTLCMIRVSAERTTQSSASLELVQAEGEHTLHFLSRRGDWLATEFELSSDEAIIIDMLQKHKLRIKDASDDESI